jgi:hypothetical protein
VIDQALEGDVGGGRKEEGCKGWFFVVEGKVAKAT